MGWIGIRVNRGWDEQMSGWEGAREAQGKEDAGVRRGQGARGSRQHAGITWAGFWGKYIAKVGRNQGSQRTAQAGCCGGWEPTSPHVWSPSNHCAARAGLLELCKQCGSEAVSYLGTLQDPGTVASADCSLVTACLSQISAIGEVGGPGGLVRWDQAMTGTTRGTVVLLDSLFHLILSPGAASQRPGHQAGGAG